jgi:hypothetical protein
LGAKAAIEGSRPRSLIPGSGPYSESQPRSDGVARSTQRGDGGRSALAPAPSRRWGGGEAAPQAASLPLHRARECSLVKLRRGQQNQFHRARSPLSVDQTRRGLLGAFQPLLAPLLTRGVSHVSSRAGRPRRVRDRLRGHAEHAPTLSIRAPEATWRVITRDAAEPLPRGALR